MSKSNWYLVQVKQNAHKLAEVNLSRQGFRCFQPLLRVTTRNGTVFKEVAKPLFPGYLFVAFDPVNAPWQKINNSLGVTRLLTRDGVPHALPNGVVEDLEARMDSTGHLLRFRNIHKGDDVFINSGPFVGLLAQVGDLEPNQRVSLLISLMGLETRLTVDVTDVDKV